MSSENVKQFIHKAQNDPLLQTQLEALPKDVDSTVVEGIVKVANAAGFQFTAEDYNTAVLDVLAQKHAAGLLNDEELALVSAGVKPRCGITTECGTTK